MKKVLVIAYYFPPMGGSGVQRSLKFVKYLGEYNYTPIVLTVDHRYTRWPKDKSLMKEIPQNTIVYRTPTLDLNWIYKTLWGLRLHKVVEWLQLHWLIPDSEITWLPFAKRQIDLICKTHIIDVVYITGGPFSSMLLGPYVSDKFNLKYVVDFRDEWTNNHTRLDRAYSEKARKMDSASEKSVLEKCSGIVYAHPEFMQENFERKYPFLINTRSRVITNGFDENDFTSADRNVSANSDVFKILYSGSFYDRRRPIILFRAILDLIESKQIKAEQIYVEIYGKNTPGFVLGEYSSNEIIRKVVKFYPYVPHKRALSVINSASALLLYLSPGPNSEPELPGKMFEYMRSYKPIIAIVPPRGSAANLIRQSKTGIVLDSADTEKVKSGLSNYINQWKDGTLSIQPDTDYITQFNRKNLTQKLASLFDEVTDTVKG